MPRPNLAAIAAELKRQADLLCPGHYGAELTVRLATGPVTIELCPDIHVVSQTSLSEGESEILEAFEGLEPDAVLQVADIAKRVGCEPGSNLRERLGRLVRMRKLVNVKPGYRIAFSNSPNLQ